MKGRPLIRILATTGLLAVRLAAQPAPQPAADKRGLDDLDALLAGIPGSSAVLSVTWSTDGNLVATGSQDGVVRFWDPTTGRETRRFRDVQAREVSALPGFKELLESARSIALSPDGKKLVVASDNGVVRLWGFRLSGEPRLQGSSVAWDAEGRRLAVGSNSGLQILEDTGTGREGPVLEGAKRISTLAWSLDGRLASGSLDHTVRIWDVEEGATVELKGHLGEVTGVAWSPNGERLASVSSDEAMLRVWSTATGQEVFHERVSAPLLAAAWSQDGHTVAAGSEAGVIWLWSLGSDEGFKIPALDGHHGAVYALSFSPRGERLLSGSADGTAGIWDVVSGEEILRLRGPAGPLSVRSVGPDRRSLVVESADGLLQAWSLGEDGEVAIREGTRFELSGAPPAHEPQVDWTLPLPAPIEVEDGRSSELAVKVTNRGEEAILRLGIRQVAPAESPWIFHPPPTQASLGPGETALLPCRVSGASAYESPQPLRAPLVLELTSASGPFRTLEPIEVLLRTPSLSFRLGRLSRDRSFDVAFSPAGRNAFPSARVLVELNGGAGAVPPQPLHLAENREETQVSFQLPEGLGLQRQLGARVVVETLERPLHRWSSEVLVGGWPWRRFWLLLAGLLLAAGMTLVELRLRPADEARESS